VRGRRCLQLIWFIVQFMHDFKRGPSFYSCAPLLWVYVGGDAVCIHLCCPVGGGSTATPAALLIRQA